MKFGHEKIGGSIDHEDGADKIARESWEKVVLADIVLCEELNLNYRDLQSRWDAYLAKEHYKTEQWDTLLGPIKESTISCRDKAGRHIWSLQGHMTKMKDLGTSTTDIQIVINSHIKNTFHPLSSLAKGIEDLELSK